MAAEAPFLALRGLARHFGATKALDGADLLLHAGSVHALVGENGAGKSTLIKCLSGVVQPDRGTIGFDGHDVAIRDPRMAEALGFRFIHQELTLVPHFDAVGNAWIGQRPPTFGPFLDRAAMRRRVEIVAGRIAPELPLDRPAIRLTPGQRQMAEIVRALMEPARLVVMDEPTSSLSEGEAERLHGIVRQLAREGCAVLFISHRLDEVMALCDDYTVLRNGRTAGAGRIGDIDRAGLVAMMSGTSSGAGLGVGGHDVSGIGQTEVPSTTERIPAPLRGGLGRGYRPWPLVSGLPGIEDGRTVEATVGTPSPTPPHKGAGLGRGAGLDLGALLSVDIVFGPGGARLLFDAYPGEIVGLYGLIGAGRSSLLKLVWGAGRADGPVRLDGKSLPAGSIASRIRAGMAYVPEDRRREGLAGPISIEANLALAHLRDFRALRHLPVSAPARIRRFAEMAGARLKLTAGALDRSPRTLSGGNQQKLLFGRWLGRPIRVLVADEPTRGVDIGAKAEIHDEMRRIAASGAAVVMATSDIEELVTLSTRILVLHGGRISAELTAADGRDAVVAAAFGHRAEPGRAA